MLNNLIYNGITPSGDLGLSSIADSFFNTKDEQTRSELFLNSLISDLKNIIQSGQYSSNMSMSGTYKKPIDYFMWNYNSRSSQEYQKECYLDLINFIS